MSNKLVLPQAAHLSMHFQGKLVVLHFLEGPVMDTPLIQRELQRKKEREKKTALHVEGFKPTTFQFSDWEVALVQLRSYKCSWIFLFNIWSKNLQHTVNKREEEIGHYSVLKLTKGSPSPLNWRYDKLSQVFPPISIFTIICHKRRQQLPKREKSFLIIERKDLCLRVLHEGLWKEKRYSQVFSLKCLEIRFDVFYTYGN